MKQIPKTTKTKLKFYKGITVLDLVIGFIYLVLLTLIVTSSFNFKWIMALVLTSLTISLFININTKRLYHFIGYFFKYRISNKKYDKEHKDYLDPNNLCIERNISVKNGVINNVDNTYTAVINIKPIELYLLDNNEQTKVINNSLVCAMNACINNEVLHIVKLDYPYDFKLVLDSEMQRVGDINESSLTQEERNVRLNLIEDRMSILDEYASNASTVNSKYFLTITSSDLNSLISLKDRVINILNSNHLQAHGVYNEDLVKFIYLQRFNGIELLDDFHFNPLEEEIKEEQLSSLVSFNNLEFNAKSTIQDSLKLSHFVINSFPLNVDNGWSYELFNMKNTKVVMKLLPVEKEKAIKRIDTSIAELYDSSFNAKASNQLDNQIHLETLSSLLTDIKEGNETLFDTTLIITAYDKLDDNSNRKQVASKIKELGFNYDDMLFRQEEAYISSQISNKEVTNISRGIQTSIVASSFPFISNEFSDEKGVLIGENQSPVLVDFFKRDQSRINSNMVIVGKSGSGKSYAAKTVISALLSENTKVFVFDPENEYSTLSKNVGGKTIDVSDNSNGIINPFEVIQDINEKNPFYPHLQFLEEFFRVILVGLSPDCFEVLNKLIVDLYESKGINAHTNFKKLKSYDYPIFDDFHKLVTETLNKENDEYLITCYKTILSYLNKFVDGGRYSDMWNGYSSLTVNEHFVNFNFQSLFTSKNSLIANAQMLLILRWVESEIIKNKYSNDSSNKVIVAIDEAHLFIDEKHLIALDFMYQLAKRIRKYDGMLIIISQSVKDFMGTKETIKKTMAIISACQYSSIFNLNPNDVSDLNELYKDAGGLNAYEVDSIINAPRGRALFILDPSTRTIFDIFASSYVKDMFQGGLTNGK